MTNAPNKPHCNQRRTRYEVLTNLSDAALQVALNPENPDFVADHAVTIAATATQERDGLTLAEAETDYWEQRARALLNRS